MPLTPKIRNRKVKNSVEFINKTNTLKVYPTEIQVPYHDVNLYPFVPLDKPIAVIVGYLKEDINNVVTKTKVTLADKHQLIELCISECYFLCNSLI